MTETDEQPAKPRLTKFKFLVAAIASLVGCMDETFTTRCANYEELVDSGLMSRRWLPDSMPKSVRDLSEAHNLDSNNVYATFFIALEDTDQLVKGITEKIPSGNSKTRIFTRKDRNCQECTRVERMTIDTKTGRVTYESHREY